MSGDRRRPEYTITIEPGALTGFYVKVADQVIACFSSAPELALWIERQYQPLDLAPEAETMPVMLQSGDSTPARKGWPLLRGGRT
jgi:hypothetical protein